MGLAAAPIIITERIQAAGQGAGTAVGTEPEIHLEDTFPLGLDQLDCCLHQMVEEFGILDGGLTVCLALVAVHQQKFDIRCIAQGSTPEFSQSQERIIRFQAGC